MGRMKDLLIRADEGDQQAINQIAELEVTNRRHRQLKTMMSLTESKSDLDVYASTYDFKFVFAVILSSQTSDIQVNKITPALFKKYPTLKSFAKANWEDVAQEINTIPFFNNKAKNLVSCASQMITNHKGEIPSTMPELLKLSGVGRKVANVILNCVHGMSGVVVDTHVSRVAQRLGWTTETKPHKIEVDLGSWIPKNLQAEASNNIVLFGRYTCRAKKPLCDSCALRSECPTLRRSQ